MFLLLKKCGYTKKKLIESKNILKFGFSVGMTIKNIVFESPHHKIKNCLLDSMSFFFI